MVQEDINEILGVTTESIKNENIIVDNQCQHNKVVKVTLTGGIIGLLSGDAIDSLNEMIKSENSKGWEVVQILPDNNINLITIVLRMLLLLITFLLYTKSNGYFIVLKKKLI